MTEMTFRGRLVADPEVTFTTTGTCRARFRLADSQRRYDPGRCSARP